MSTAATTGTKLLSSLLPDHDNKKYRKTMQDFLQKI